MALLWLRDHDLPRRRVDARRPARGRRPTEPTDPTADAFGRPRRRPDPGGRPGWTTAEARRRNQS